MRRSRWQATKLGALVMTGVFASGLALLESDLRAAERQQSGIPAPRRHSVRWIADPSDANNRVVEISGIDAATLRKLQQLKWKLPQWQRLLSVYAEQGDLMADLSLPAMLGAYRVELDVLRFEPQFPLEPGVKYRAVFHPDQLPDQRSAGAEVVTAVFQRPLRSPSPTTAVSHVYPSAEVLPENLLKFYVHFSAPMSRGHIYDHIHLRDDAGKDVELPFLEIDEELWDPSMMRLTLFIDPGRIKRGVRPLEEVGPALQEGRRYALVIDHSWNDAAGNPLKGPFQKRFKVGPPDREPPDPARWNIQSPNAETREPLVVTFPEAMDHALAQRLIRPLRESGELVEGKAALENDEYRWSFIPDRPWRRGPYELAIHATIEDLAGNNIGKPFEVDLFEEVQKRPAHSVVKLPFELR